MLSGWKTNLISIAIGVVAALRAMELIDEQVANLLVLFLTGGGLAALRDGIKTETRRVTDTQHLLANTASDTAPAVDKGVGAVHTFPPS